MSVVATTTDSELAREALQFLLRRPSYLPNSEGSAAVTASYQQRDDGEVYLDRPRPSILDVRRQQQLIVYGGLWGLSLLLTSAGVITSDSSQKKENGVKGGRHNPRRPSMDVLFQHLHQIEHHRRVQEMEDKFFRKNDAYAKAREEKYEKVRLAIREEEAKQAPFKPTISDFALNAHAPKTINDFFPRGIQWLKSREKKLKAKRDKLQAEVDEVEKEQFKPWQMSAASAHILNRQKKTKAKEEDNVRRANADDSSLLSSGVAERNAKNRREARSFFLNDAHHSPVMSNTSREITKDYPPFEYRLRISMEKKQNILRQHEFSKQMKEADEAAQCTVTVPTRTPCEIQDMVERLYSPVRRSLEVPAEEVFTFSPTINEASRKTPTRHLTPTLRLKETVESSAQRRRALQNEGTHTPRRPSPVKQPPALSDAERSFLARTELWSKDRSHNRADIDSRAEQEFKRKHSFHPFVSPVSQTLVKEHDERLTSTILHDDHRRHWQECSSYLDDVVVGNVDFQGSPRSSDTNRGGGGGVAYLAPAAPTRGGDGRSPAKLHKADVDYLVRHGFHGKPVEPAFASPFRQSPRRQLTLQSRSPLRGGSRVQPCPQDELLVRHPLRSHGDPTRQVSLVSSPPAAAVGLAHRQEGYTFLGTLDNSDGPLQWSSVNTSREHHHHQQQQQQQQRTSMPRLDAETTADLQRWWQQLDGGSNSRLASGALSSSSSFTIRERSVALCAACDLVEAVTSARPSMQLQQQVTREFHSDVIFSDFVRMFQLLLNC